MDIDCFDHLTRTLGAAGTRRGLIRLLATLPISGALLAGLGDESEADRRHKRQRDAAHRQRIRTEGKKKGKRKKRRTTPAPVQGCTPESAAKTCAGRCGQVTNNCGTPVNCGSCICSPACPLCQRCNAETGRCEPNPAFLGLVCGAPGQVCQADGGCACDSGSCAAGQRCNGLACVCDGTSCPTGCCDGTSCRIADDRACGTGGGACTICAQCQVCNGAGQCEADIGQNRTSCRVAGGGAGVCCEGVCCAGCCDGNEECGACLAFVTSTSYTGNLGGLAGADAKCQARAAAGNLPGTYKAWLSNDTNPPATRFRCRAASCSAEGYERVDGVTIANDWTDLTTCGASNDDCLDAPLNRSELDTTVTTADGVWTNTETDGTVGTPGGLHCQNWTNGTSGTGRVADSSSRGLGWTDNDFAFNCGNPRPHLYCFQQS